MADFVNIALDRVVVGRRHRRDMGDIAELAESLERDGLLHPIVVTPGWDLVAGARRLKAARHLKWKSIAAHVIDIEKLARGEYAENHFRKAFLPTELAAIVGTLEKYERELSKKRQILGARAGGRGDGRLGGIDPQLGRAPRTMDRIGRQVGKDRRTLEKINHVMAAVQEDEERYGDLPDMMDGKVKGGKVNVDGAYLEMRRRQDRIEYEARCGKGQTVEDLKKLKAGGYKVIYADPPWDHGDIGRRGRSEYNRQSVQEIGEMPVERLAAGDCALFLWAVSPLLPDALDVMKAWGFEFKGVAFVWVKTSSEKVEAVQRDGDGLHWGIGKWTRANVEMCLLGVRGKPRRLDMGVHQVVLSPVEEHSRKPEEVRRRIERLLVGPYLELYGRRKVKEWSVWGNEIVT